MRMISELHLTAALLSLQQGLTYDAQGMQGRLRGVKDHSGPGKAQHNVCIRLIHSRTRKVIRVMTGNALTADASLRRGGTHL